VVIADAVTANVAAGDVTVVVAGCPDAGLGVWSAAIGNL
jgi:hypothetical protein